MEGIEERISDMEEKTETTQLEQLTQAALTCGIIPRDLVFMSLEFWKERGGYI